MDPDLHQVIELLHATPARVAVSTTGAGGQVLGWLLTVAGASNTLLEGVVPYAYASLDEHLRRVDADTQGVCVAIQSRLARNAMVAIEYLDRELDAQREVL